VSAEAWIALAGIGVTLLLALGGGLLALWFQGGRILERVDNLKSGQRKQGERLDDQERRLHRVELIVQPSK